MASRHRRSDVANETRNGGTVRRRNQPTDAAPRAGGKSSSRNATAFNPRLIFAQIVSMQCFHYLILGLIFQMNHVLFSTSVTIDRIFTTNYVKIWSIEGLADSGGKKRVYRADTGQRASCCCCCHHLPKTLKSLHYLIISCFKIQQSCFRR